MALSVILFLLVIAAYIADIVFGIYCKIRNSKFKKFLEENRDELLNGGSCVFYGQTYTSDTLLVRYQVCVSALVITSTSGTSFFPAEEGGKIRVLCNAISLLAGWWGLPWGPIRLFQTVKYNFEPDCIPLYNFYE